MLARENDLTIKNLVEIIVEVIGYKGIIEYDSTKPDGAPRKYMDSTRLNKLGWQPIINLEEGLMFTYQDFLKTKAEGNDR